MTTTFVPFTGHKYITNDRTSTCQANVADPTHFDLVCDHGLSMQAVYKLPKPGASPTVWEYVASSPLINSGLPVERTFSCEPSSVKSLRASLDTVSSITPELRAVNAYIKDFSDDMVALKCHIPPVEENNISDGYHYLVRPHGTGYLNTTIIGGSISDTFFLES